MNTLDAFGLQVLTQAVNWLFVECSKILQERRERRQEQLKARPPQPETVTQPSTTENAPDVIQSMSTALNQQVNETAWKNSESEVKHLLSLLEIYTRNYRLYKEQYATWTSALVPPHIASGLTEAEDKIAATAQELQTVLSKVYGKKLMVPELEQV